MHICRSHHLKELVGSIVLQSSYLACSIIHRESFRIGESGAFLFVESSAFCSVRFFGYEMLFIIKEDDPHDPPHVVDEVGIEEVHRPPLS